MTVLDEGAACKGLTALFYSDLRADKEAAIAVCVSCPVLTECRADAQKHETATQRTFGVRYGLTAQQRSSTPKLGRARQPCGTEAGKSTHRRYHEPPCPDCRAAAARSARQRRTQQRR